ncbi:MAG: zinc-dependent metalloprotease [Sandaracinaceae bacterium]
MLLVALAALFAVGCVEAQPPVNTVQPNVTRKTDLAEGEYYFLQTVVDTPYTTDFTFVGEQGRMERVRWEVQEDFLIARRAYEAIAGSEPEGINGTSETAGAPLAIYRIQSHFDIRRRYNPVTGEELNVIEENQERAWFDREFMRVEWSENLVENPDFLMLSRYFGGVEVSPVSWHVEQGENAPRFERLDPEDEASPLAYMEITNKMLVRPTTTDIPGLGPLPTCFLMQAIDGNPVDCAEGEITVRNAFLRVDPEHDYEPQVYTGDRMDRFGYFVTERPGYDLSYGLVEPARYRFVNRHNLWEQSHRRDDAGAIVACTADAQCADGRGSRCDLDYGRAARSLTDDREIEGACTIPFRDREARPVTYHLSANFPEDLRPEMEMVEREWSRAFVDTVASLREQECLATGGSECAAERTRDDARQMFHVCVTPVPEGAPEACGEVGMVARIGDPRHSLIGWVNEPHRAAPLGYGPSAADPLTGEILAGNAFLYGAGMESVSTFGRDIVRLLNGDLTEEEIASGAPVEAWVERLSGAREAGADRTASTHVIEVDGADAENIDAAMDFSWIRGGHNHARGASGSPGEMVERVRDAFSRLGQNGALGDGLSTGAGRLARLQGTEVERMMTTREARMMAGIDPDLPVDDAVIAQASPLRGMRADQIIALERARDRFQQEAGIDWGEFADEGLLGLARAIQRAGENGATIEWNGVAYDIAGPDGQPDYEAVRDMLRHPILSGLALHEVGHTLGLRHNFSGSADALNYQPGYWELRDDGNMRPRAYDPMTQAELDGRIMEYAYSTVMDYGHNFVVTDAHGIGHYDRAAIKMGYGDLVEVFESVPDVSEMAWASFIQSAGWPVPIRLETAFGGEMSAYTYTEWPALVGGRAAMEARADVPYESLETEVQLARSGIDHPSQDPEGRIAVPYRFCSDEQADLSPGCYRYDAGADAYESVQSVIDSYWNYYIFNNYRRQRLGFNVGGTANRILGRYFEKLQRANQTYALYRGVFQDAFGDSPGYDAFWTREDGMGGYTAAVGAAYQLLLRVVTSPEPGGYSMDRRGDGLEVMTPGGAAQSVDGFDGRFLETTWNFDAGYFWFDQLERVGYFYDKVLALQVLSDPTTYFLGRDTDSDIRRYQLNFASTFGPSMTRFYGGVLGEDWTTIAPRFQGSTLVYPDALQIEHGDMPGTPVAPNASFSIQLYAAVFGMALIPQTYDQQFLNRSRVWVRGGAEAIEVDPSVELVEYTDPDSGLTYQAARYADDAGVELGVGARLIERAIVLRERANAGDERAAGELSSFIDNLDLVRMLTWHLGFGAQP